MQTLTNEQIAQYASLFKSSRPGRVKKWNRIRTEAEQFFANPDNRTKSIRTQSGEMIAPVAFWGRSDGVTKDNFGAILSNVRADMRKDHRWAVAGQWLGDMEVLAVSFIMDLPNDAEVTPDDTANARARWQGEGSDESAEVHTAA